jgi:hypothetical protein
MTDHFQKVRLPYPEHGWAGTMGALAVPTALLLAVVYLFAI